jgi:hypothetical protein
MRLNSQRIHHIRNENKPIGEGGTEGVFVLSIDLDFGLGLEQKGEVVEVSDFGDDGHRGGLFFDHHVLEDCFGVEQMFFGSAELVTYIYI